MCAEFLQWNVDRTYLISVLLKIERKGPNGTDSMMMMRRIMANGTPSAINRESSFIRCVGISSGLRIGGLMNGWMDGWRGERRGGGEGTT